MFRPWFLASSLLLLAQTVTGADPQPRDFNLFVSGAVTQANRHGRASFRSGTIEWTGLAQRFLRRLPHTTAGASVTYSDVIQPRSWFGRRDGDPYNHVRAEWAHLFLRREWRSGSSVRPWIDLGSGPMWSNRRIPAATSRFNFHSQLGLGLEFGALSRYPLYIGYRFSHISNMEFARRNPGWDVHALILGVRVRSH